MNNRSSECIYLLLSGVCYLHCTHHWKVCWSITSATAELEDSVASEAFVFGPAPGEGVDATLLRSFGHDGDEAVFDDGLILESCAFSNLSFLDVFGPTYACFNTESDAESLRRVLQDFSGLIVTDFFRSHGVSIQPSIQGIQIIPAITMPESIWEEAAARLSGATHEVPLLGKGLVWVWPLWYLANEMSTLTGLTKMEASIVLLPLVRETIGSFGYGTLDNLHRIEETIGQTLTDLVAPAAAALGAEITATIGQMDVERISDQTFSQWAGTGLALGLASHEQIQELFSTLKQHYLPTEMALTLNQSRE